MNESQLHDVANALNSIEAATRTIRSSLDLPTETVGQSDGGGFDIVRCAVAMIDGRERLSVHLPGDMFADPALDILLDLFVAGERDELRTSKAASIASRVPSTTALRWIGILVERGLVERLDDPGDGRITLLRLSDMARRGMRDWLTACADFSHRH